MLKVNLKILTILCLLNWLAISVADVLVAHKPTDLLGDFVAALLIAMLLSFDVKDSE